jgi:hypothetical protein
MGVAGLLVLNLWFTLTTDVGPDPEVEALHSEAAAVLVCRDGVESRLTDRSPSILDSGRSEYLQGG